MSSEADHAKRTSLSRYYNASQLRADTWNRLKVLAQKLAEKQARKADIQRLQKEVEQVLATLEPIESYWAFPSKQAFQHIRMLFDQGDYSRLSRLVARIGRALVSQSYRRGVISLTFYHDAEDEANDEAILESFADLEDAADRPYFEVLVVDNISERDERTLRAGLRGMRRPEDGFVYDVVVVPSFEDALIAVLFNYNIQAVVIRYGFPFESRHRLEVLQRYLEGIDDEAVEGRLDADHGPLLGALIGNLRPELDLYLVTDAAVEAVAGEVVQNFSRIFYRQEDYLELHLSILRGVNARYESPFFTALREYSRQPTGVFHAMPISRGKSITKSHWIQDMARFYGINVFLAETSATSGGLDSLLEPHGPIKKAQELAARAFGARRTFFVTNGTSTANKVVMQALVTPGDIVLVDRDCHKSMHYGMVLGGGYVDYLDAYPLNDYSMYGAVPLEQIKRRLLAYKRAGRLDRVRLLVLTSCTFDGLIYNVERVMEECLAIKPDLVFLWDEAWFAFARFAPVYRQRTAMFNAERLRARYASAEYRERYEAFRKTFDKLDADADETWLENRLMPDPDRVRVRVYATHSTHKTLTSLRQGSMIHVNDQDYRAKTEEAFHEAYMTHTSTSPNYQILASLDIGRRQVELEGYELVQKQIELAMVLRERIKTHPLLSKYFRFLSMKDLVPPEYRPSGIEVYYDPKRGWSSMEEAWATDEFALDPTRLTLFVGATGMNGDTFKNRVLMDKFGIQVNKTSLNTVLFMTNIGTTRSSVAYLIEVLVRVAEELEQEIGECSPLERRLHDKRVASLTEDLPPLPDFSHFHDAFRPHPKGDTPEGDIRSAYFMPYDDANCRYLDTGEIDRAIAAGEQVVSAMFVIPYPPGFPILVPGQVVSAAILDYMRRLDVKEIHGYRPELGLRVFTDEALAAATGKRPRKAAAE